MRITLHEPSGGISQLSAWELSSILHDAGAPVAIDIVCHWTELERLVAYDWAAREHLAAADNPVHRRPIPYFVARETQQ